MSAADTAMRVGALVFWAALIAGTGVLSLRWLAYCIVAGAVAALVLAAYYRRQERHERKRKDAAEVLREVERYKDCT